MDLGFDPDEDCLYAIGDMILSKTQLNEALGLSTRSGISGAYYRWPDGIIPYKFHPFFSRDSYKGGPNDADKYTVKKAIQRFNNEMKGCLEIV